MSARTARGTGRPDWKMSRSEDPVKRARYGTGTEAHQAVQRKANSKRRQRDRSGDDQG